jgi:hypothetical protein
MPRISSVHSNCRRKKSVIYSRNTFFSRFSCHEGALYGRIRLRRGEQDLPEVFARKRASPKASDRRSMRCSGRLRREKPFEHHFEFGSACGGDAPHLLKIHTDIIVE